MLYKLPTIAENVLELVREKPKVLENSNVLVIEYWIKYDQDALTAFESITRCLRKLIEMGEVIVPDDVKKKKRALKHEYEFFFRNWK